MCVRVCVFVSRSSRNETFKSWDAANSTSCQYWLFIAVYFFSPSRLLFIYCQSDRFSLFFTYSNAESGEGEARDAKSSSGRLSVIYDAFPARNAALKTRSPYKERIMLDGRPNPETVMYWRRCSYTIRVVDSSNPTRRFIQFSGAVDSELRPELMELYNVHAEQHTHTCTSTMFT